MSKISRKDLVALASELNEKRDASIEVGKKATEQDIIDGILEATNGGEDPKKLGKVARATLEALIATLQPATVDDEGSDDASGETDELPEDLTSREAMNLAAADMNQVMGLDPGIDTAANDKVFKKAFETAANMAGGSDNFSDYTWKVLEALGVGPERLRAKPAKAEKKAEKKADKKAETKAPKEAKAKAEKKPAAKKEPKGPGVLSTIKAFLDEKIKSKKGVFTRDELHAHMTKAFPERDADALLATIKTQIPGKMSKERGYGFVKKDDKYTVTAPKE